MTRDGRGVYFSRRQSGFSREESLRGWKNYNKKALRLLVKNIPPEDLLQVKYENLASKPGEQLAIITDFLNIPYEDNLIQLDSSVRHMVNGNVTMFSPQKGVKLDERWKTGLNDTEISYVEKQTGSLNERLGYQ